MAHKTAVEKLKEHEYDIIIKAQVRNFKVEITDNLLRFAGRMSII